MKKPQMEQPKKPRRYHKARHENGPVGRTAW